MARYHFNLYNGDGLVEDEEGRELDGLDEARSEALKGVRSIIADEVLQGRIDLTGRLEVVDAEGAPVLTIAFRDAVQIVT
jgi:hypothetical protein